jgi:hypothetical protein
MCVGTLLSQLRTERTSFARTPTKHVEYLYFGGNLIQQHAPQYDEVESTFTVHSRLVAKPRIQDLILHVTAFRPQSIEYADP